MSVETIKNEWRMIRIQLLNHMLNSETWADMKKGADVMFKVALQAKDMISEAEYFNKQNDVMAPNSQSTQPCSIDREPDKQG